MHRVKELSLAERAKWGKCPVCGAEDEYACDTTDHADDVLMVDGHLAAHEVRLRKAPLKVRIIKA